MRVHLYRWRLTTRQLSYKATTNILTITNQQAANIRQEAAGSRQQTAEISQQTVEVSQ
jgi:hypothetical protein